MELVNSNLFNIECNGENYDETNLNYLLHHQSIEWTSFEWKQYNALPNTAILFENVAIGRIVMNNMTYIGRVTTNEGIHVIINGSSSATPNFDILTCNTNKMSFRKQEITLRGCAF